MRQITVNTTPPQVKTTEYAQLAGIDLSQEAVNVDKSRSPYCLNMISDNGKNPVKRAGWETKIRFDGAVHNIWFAKISGRVHILVHAGTSIYRIAEEDGEYSGEVLYGGVADSKGCGFFFRKDEKDGFYILTGGEYLVFDGAQIKSVREDAYIPTTIIARTPTGGGESYEDINFLTGKMCEKFTGTEDALVYQLAHTDIEKVIKVEELDGEGVVQPLAADTDYTVDKALGKITFTAAHETPVDGQDNIYITYEKEFEGYADRILKATQFCTYGVGGHNRVFVTGNSEFEAYDFWSDIYRPDYFPDTNFAIVGNADTAIKGYLKIGDNVAIVKETTGQDTAIFLRSGSMNDDGSVNFFVSPGIVGIGAVSQYAFGVLNDDPLFLSEQGVYAISPSSLSFERVTRNRSYYIDPALREEDNLENAVACIWNGCYVLAVNGKAYILDGRKRTGSTADNYFKYECYLWDNIDASCIATDFDGILWFGTADGAVRRFKTDIHSMKKYSDDGAAIRAVWSTPCDDDGAVQRFKTLQKKGCLVVLAPFAKSSGEVYYAVDGKTQRFIRSGAMNISSLFGVVDFEALSFISDDGPREIYFNKKQRKYKRLQLVFENNKADEGFGIYKIVKTYTVGGWSKNRRR